jgi:hypothetical protein
MVSSFKKKSVILIVTSLVISMSLLSGMLLSASRTPGTRGLKAWNTRPDSDDIHSRCSLPVCSKVEHVADDKPFHNTPPFQASLPTQFDGKLSPVHEELFSAPQATWRYCPCSYSPRQQPVLVGADLRGIYQKWVIRFYLTTKALIAGAIKGSYHSFTHLGI